MSESSPKAAEIIQETSKPQKLFNKNYLLLWQGQFISKLGNQVYAIVIILWLKEMTNSGSIIGMFGMAAGIPVIFLSAFGGAVADRFSRKRIIIFSDIINGITTISLALIMFTNPENVNLIVAYLFLVVIISSSINAFFGPAISASIPDLVPEKRVAGANSMGNFSDKISVFLGQALGGMLFRILGAPIIVLFDGISYLISAFSESFITIPQKIPENAPDIKSQFQSFKKDIKEGIDYITQSAGLKRMLLISVVLSFFSMPIIVLLPFYVELQLHAPDEWFGFLMAIYGIGALVGYIIVGIFRLPGRKRKKFFIAFMLLESSSYIFLGAIQSKYMAGLVFFLGGVFSGFIMVIIITILQLTTPSEIRGRVFGVLTMISASASPIGMGLGGVIADLTDKNIPLIYMVCGGIMVLWGFISSFNRDFRGFIGYETEEEMEPTGFTYKLRRTSSEEILKNVDPRVLYIENRIPRARSEL